VAGAMTARGLSARVSAVAALVLSLSIGGLMMAYYSQKVHPPYDAGYGLYIAAAAAIAAGLCSLWALLAALTSHPQPR
jgi:multisubunit Na+/H+ antiporter MnhB subunit